MHVSGFRVHAGSILLTASLVLSSPGAWGQHAGNAKQYVPKAGTAVRTSGPIDMASDAHFRTVVRNDRVRVLQLNLGAGESTPLNTHQHDYVVVSLGSSQFEAVGEISRFPFALADGEIRVVNGGWPHKLVNTGTGAARLVLIEVTRGIAPASASCGLSGPSCSGVRFGVTREGRYSQALLFETPTLRLLRGELGPNGSLPKQSEDFDRLIVPLTPARIADAFEEVSDAQAGGAIWRKGGLGVVRNVGDQDARMLILELK